MNLGFSKNELGLVTTIYNLSFAISALPAGILSDIIMSGRYCS
jgi:MFS family permease